jgi:hypothetical protein
MRHTRCVAPIDGVEGREPRPPSHGPNGGVADSLQNARDEAFRAAWERRTLIASVLLWEGRADERCSVRAL